MIQMEPLPDSSPGEIEYQYVMTPMQQGMLYHMLHTPRPGMYVRQMIYSLNEQVDVGALTRAWQLAIRRHPSLRTSVKWEGLDEPIQRVHKSIEVHIKQEDWRGLPGKQREARLESFTTADRERGFDLGRPPLMRLTLIRLGEELYTLVYTFPHILSDGFSDLMLSREVFASYEAFCEGAEPILETPVAFRLHAEWLRSQDLSQAEAFWRERLGGINAPTLIAAPPARSQAATARRPTGRRAIYVPVDVTKRLRDLIGANGLSLSTIVHGVWALLLGRYSGAREVVFGGIRGCRRSALDGAGAATAVGPVINSVPVRIRIRPESDVLSWLKEVRAEWVAIAPYEHTPVVKIQSWAGLPQGTPLFESVVTYDKKHLITVLKSFGGGWARRGLRIPQALSNYPLTIASHGEEGLNLTLHYDRRRFTDDFIERMATHMERLFAEIATKPEQKVSELNLMSSAERRQLLVDFNGVRTPYESHKSVHGLFEEQAVKRPTAIAVECGDERLTYSSLNERANRLARHLRSKNVAPDSVVGLCLPRGIEMVVAMLAILKAGAAYLPLDPSYPRARLSHMLEDARSPVVISREELAGSVSQGPWELVLLDRGGEEISGHSQENLSVEVGPDNLAYVIYTSGSTGEPKGVAVCHRGVIRLVRGADYVELDEDEAVLQASSATFDASTFEIWGALLNGGRLVAINQRVPMASELARVIREKNVTTVLLTTSLFNSVMDQEPGALGGIRQLLIGGEALSVEHVLKAAERMAGTRIINGYGPTESTTFAIAYTVKGGRQDYVSSIPIGRAISNTQAYILDDRLELVPVGLVGEIYIGGDGLARGYLNKPDLTAERFIPNPYGRAAGERLYKTGDLACYLPEGQVEFLGRKDNQVKVRGYRIEPEEIEATLGKCPGVRQAAVITKDDSSGSKRLVAYVVAEESTGLGEVRLYLRESLPEYMIPSAIFKVAEMPLNQSGKIDRRALLELEKMGADAGHEFVAPSTPAQKIIADVWREVLNVKQVGLNDNFFDLGGHSLLAMQVTNRLRKSLNRDIPLNWLLEYPTVGSLASVVADPSADHSAIYSTGQ